MTQNIYDHIIIGGGAAGYFAAINLLEDNSNLKVAILERAGRPLIKLGLTGGGRCNITNGTRDVGDFIKKYPRGGRELRAGLGSFGSDQTMQWFEDHGILLKEESEGRVFPVSDSAAEVVDYFVARAQQLGVDLYLKCVVTDVIPLTEGFEILSSEGSFFSKVVLLASGGMIKPLDWLVNMGHNIIEPIPALFTLAVPISDLLDLGGISATVKLALKGTDFKSEGDLLLTHWGFSGPAVLKLSSFAARWLCHQDYCAELMVDWLPEENEEAIFKLLKVMKNRSPNKKVVGSTILGLSRKLWARFTVRFVSEGSVWGVLSDKILRRWSSMLKRDSYKILGKGAYKQQFVTAGGVSLKEVNLKSMESKIVSGLYFAGEVLDVDALTGGYNLQNAWTTAHLYIKNFKKA